MAGLTAGQNTSAYVAAKHLAKPNAAGARQEKFKALRQVRALPAAINPDCAQYPLERVPAQPAACHSQPACPDRVGQVDMQGLQPRERIADSNTVWSGTCSLLFLDETYLAGLADLVNAQLRHPFAAKWDNGSTPSSDGQRSRSGGRAESTGRINVKYGVEPGKMIYTHIADNYAP